MYRRPKFLEKLIDIRSEMAREADYDVDLFIEMARKGSIEETDDETIALSPAGPETHADALTDSVH